MATKRQKPTSKTIPPAGDTVGSVLDFVEPVPEPLKPRLKEPPETDAHFDATRMYLNEIGFSPLLTAEEEVYYSRLAQKGDESGRRRMIESNLRLVVKIARRYINRGLAFLDLIEE
ncbi:RNA polymerase sigma factor RpoS, partial [hydrothermal vent metagenome]